MSDCQVQPHDALPTIHKTRNKKNSFMQEKNKNVMKKKEKKWKNNSTKEKKTDWFLAFSHFLFTFFIITILTPPTAQRSL